MATGFSPHFLIEGMFAWADSQKVKRLLNEERCFCSGGAR